MVEAGATPEWWGSAKQVISKTGLDVNLIDHEVIKEDIVFNLPKSLR